MYAELQAAFLYIYPEGSGSPPMSFRIRMIGVTCLEQLPARNTDLYMDCICNDTTDIEALEYFVNF